MSDLKRKDIIYYARIIPASSIYDVCELTLRTVESNWFVGIDKRDKRAYIFNDSDINKVVFKNRKDALKKVLNAEANKKYVSSETYYEEY